MHTTRHTARRTIVPALAFLLAMVVGGCGPGDVDAAEATNVSDANDSDANDSDANDSDANDSDASGEASGQGEVAPAAANSSDEPADADRAEGGEASDDIALGEITDPSEIDDPDDVTDDVAPDSSTPAELRRAKTEIQELLKQGDVQLADERASAVLERNGLDPDFRLELEAYRDLARAAGTGDKPAAGDAIDRLQRFEPEFVDELAVRRVLPEGVLPKIDLDQAGVAAATENPPTENPPAERAADDAASKGGAQLDALTEALAAEDWRLANRLAADVLANGNLTSEDTARARAYGQLAEAHTRADADAIARATESLAALDPDLVRRLAPRSVAVDAEPTARSDG